MPPGWENFCCADLAKLIKELRNALVKRLFDMRNDVQGIYNNPNTGYGTWEGHQQMFQQTQKQIRKVLEKYNSKNCQDPLPTDTKNIAFMATPTEFDSKPNQAANYVPTWNLSIPQVSSATVTVWGVTLTRTTLVIVAIILIPVGV